MILRTYDNVAQWCSRSRARIAWIFGASAAALAFSVLSLARTSAAIWSVWPGNGDPKVAMHVNAWLAATVLFLIASGTCCVLGIGAWRTRRRLRKIPTPPCE